MTDPPTGGGQPEDEETTPEVSVVVPARNEADRLPATVDALVAYLEQHPGAEVVLAVDVGSADDTAGVAEQLSGKHPCIRVTTVHSKGKGYAVRAGVEAARGALVVTADADLAVDPIDFDALAQEARQGSVAIASRSVPGARRVGEPLVRYVLGRVFNVTVRAFVLPGIRDTQCGFKAFPRELGVRLLREVEALGWVFDVDLLARARRDGIQVVEVPVVWHYRHGSSVRPIQDLGRVVAQLWRVRRSVGRQRGQTPSGVLQDRPG